MGQIFQGFSTNSFEFSSKHNCYLNGKLPYILKQQWFWKTTDTLTGIATYLLNFVHISLPTNSMSQTRILSKQSRHI